MKRRIPYTAALWALCAVLAGCATLGMEKPQSLDERISNGVTSLTAINDAVANSLASHGLSSDDAESVLKETRKGKGLLDTAQVAADGGDINTAEGRLNLGLAALAKARDYLAQKGVTVKDKP